MELAGGIILNEKNDILLLHRNTPKRQQWEIPGGKVEEGETAQTAAMRELNEELNVLVSIKRTLGETNFQEDGNKLHYTWFLVQILSGTPSIQEPDKFDDLRYISLEELYKMKDLSSNMKNFLSAHKLMGLV